MSWQALQSDPSFWVAVSFAVFVAGFGRPLWRRLAAVLDGRRDAIRAEIAEARRFRDEAQDRLNEQIRRRKGADEEAEAILERAREEAKRLAEEGARRLEAELERARERTRQEIERAREAAAAEYRGRLSALVVRATEALVRERLDADAHRALAERAVDGLGEALAGSPGPRPGG